MCCFFKRKGKKKKCSELAPAPTAHASKRNVVDQKTAGKSRLQNGTRSVSLYFFKNRFGDEK